MGFALLAVACNAGNPRVGASNYQAGTLGNGSFLFQCDDSVSCDRWSNSATTFPERVASGSTFELRFVEKGDEYNSGNIDVSANEQKQYDGTTIEGVGPNVGRGTKGFAPTKPGLATFMARDAKGWIIDYFTIEVVQPESIAIIQAGDKSADPARINEVNDFVVGSSRELVAIGEYQKETVAGAIKVEFVAEDSSVAQVESYTRGVAKIRAKGPGKTKIKVQGAGLTREIDVEVSQ